MPNTSMRSFFFRKMLLTISGSLRKPKFFSMPYCSLYSARRSVAVPLPALELLGNIRQQDKAAGAQLQRGDGLVILNDPGLDLVAVTNGGSGAVLGRSAAAELGSFNNFGPDLMIAAPGVSGELVCGLERIGSAEELAAGGVFDSSRKLASLLFQEAFDALVAPFVVSAGMDHDRPVVGPIEGDHGLQDPIARCRTFAGRRGFGQGPDIGPLVGIGGHGLVDGSGALVEGGRKPAEKVYPVFFRPLEVVPGDQGRIGHIDESARIDAMAGHMPGDTAEQFVVQGLVRSVAVAGGADDGNIAIDTEHFDQKLLQIGVACPCCGHR